jgi:hypothetical protein
MALHCERVVPASPRARVLKFPSSSGPQPALVLPERDSASAGHDLQHCGAHCWRVYYVNPARALAQVRRSANGSPIGSRSKASKRRYQTQIGFGFHDVDVHVDPCVTRLAHRHTIASEAKHTFRVIPQPHADRQHKAQTLQIRYSAR